MLLVVLLSIGALAGCQTKVAAPPPLPIPRPAHGTPSIVVFGDSLTPVPDYQAQARALGYTLSNAAYGGSHVCTVREGLPAWHRILLAIERFDVVILQYQGWQNYTEECGGPATGLPGGHQVEDPGQRWRAYLTAFAEAAQDNATRIYIAESPGAPPDARSWAIPMAIMDEASRTVAAEFPHHLTFVPSRRYFTDAQGRWVERSGCLAQEAQWCEDGSVRLRGKDRIHYACPGTTGLTCASRSPSGTRHAHLMFAAITAPPRRPVVPNPKPPPAT